MRWLTALFLLFTLTVSLSAQAPLSAPLLAAVPAQQDRVVLYQIGEGGAVVNQRVLQLGAFYHNLWGFSPDGCRVLYTLVDGDGLGRAFTARLDGSDAVEVVEYTELPDSAWGVWEPQWSSDGSRIAFTMARDGFEGVNRRQYHIGWVEVTEGAYSGAPQFYSNTGREHTPQWSPAGEWLVYTSYEERVPGADILSTAVPTPEGSTDPVPLIEEADLWVVSADAATKYQLTNFPVGSVSMPRWSPDGELISFVHSPSPGNDTFWMIANAREALPTQLSYMWSLALDLTWLPDSSGLVAAVRDFKETGANRLWRLPLVGNADNDAVPFTENPTVIYADYPRFSPDGRYVALRSAYTLTVIDTETNTTTLIDETAPGNTPPVWAPAGFQGESACG